MRWHALGHAMWLVEADGLRLLFDPLLRETHHGGVFEVVPRRRVNVEALRPDFVLVSHAHTDHFDPESLLALARLDPESVVVTPDAIVEQAALRLGFRTVKRVPPATRVELDGPTVVTTPSIDPGEWGALVGSGGVVAWNQVDTYLPDGVLPRVHEEARAARGGEVDESPPIDLAMIRWAPLIEVAPLVGHRTAFPYSDYATSLARAAELRAGAIVPAAAGGSHLAPYEWMNRFTHPVSEARFLRDVARAAPASRALPHAVGGTYAVVPGGAELDAGGARGLVELEGGTDPRVFMPTSVPAVEDRDREARAPAALVERVRRWVSADLAPSLARAFASCPEPLSFLLKLVAADGAHPFVVRVEGGAATVSEREEPEWDALVEVAASALVDVIDARSCFGDVLLSGVLRGFTRAYEPRSNGLARIAVEPIFLYHALSYDESFRRWVERELVRLC
jgi:hypothetical protein